MGFSTTMKCYFKQDPTEMYKLRCYYKKIQIFSLLEKDGVSQEKFRLMVMNV